MADPTKYLLPSERPVINIRRHWAVLAGSFVQSLLLLAVGILLARIAGGTGFVRMLAVYFCVFVVARWLWIYWQWYVEKLIVTDKRLLLLTGIFTRNVAIMPLVKVTDLTFNRSATGLLLGYGKFVVESAGQDQALSTIDYVPRPERLYIQISELLFGGDKGAPGALVTAAQYEAEEESDREARGMWRRFVGGRRRGSRGWTARPDQPDGPGAADATPAPATSRLDDLLARRDTLLADRDDPDYRRPDADGDFPDDRRADARGWEPGRSAPRIHEPRRGDGGGYGGYDNGFDTGFRDRDPSGDGPLLPPPRRPRDEPPPGTEPIDD